MSYECEYIKPILGHNIGTQIGYVSTIDRAIETGADVYQFFYRPSRSYKDFSRPKEQTQELANKLGEHDKRVVIHASYIINICQPQTDYRHFKGVKILTEDMKVAEILGSTDPDRSIGVIVHMGNNPDDLDIEECKDNYVLGIKTALKNTSSCILLLENGAGTGTEVSTSLDELGAIRDSLTRAEQKRVGFCLDTCHLYAAGYRVDDPLSVEVLDIEIERYLGWDNVKVVHLNDSKNPYDSHKDNHQDIGKGTMNFFGLMAFVRICADRKIPMILETPCNYYDDVRYDSKMQMQNILDYQDLMYNPKRNGILCSVNAKTDSHKEIKKLSQKASR